MSKQEKNELVESKGFNVTVGGNLDVSEEMAGLSVAFDKVKIPSGGGVAFEVPGDDPESPDMVKELMGVLVDHYPVNAYWANPYDGANNAPDCSSMDGVVGVDVNNNMVDCATCRYNQWGSDPRGGKGKACKNMRRLYILREGEMFPLQLTLPPTSIKNFGDYITKRVLSKGMPSTSVVTKISLKKNTNATGIGYSEAVFALADTLPAEQANKLAEFSKNIKAMTRRVSIDTNDYNVGGASNPDDDVM